jgi:acyl-CoA reductase-like NAD-dependent aldehyde dehydrogenase
MNAWAPTALATARDAAGALRLPDKMLISGEWCDSAGGGRMEVVNPYTEEALGTIPAGNGEDVARAVGAARQAFADGPWRRMSGRERGNLLRRIAGLLREHQEEFALLECLDNGKPIGESRWAAPAAAEVFEYYAGWADKYHGEVVPLKNGDLSIVTHEPVGVIGCIIPWNFPTTQACFKVAPAIAMGNSAVLKPAEQCSLPSLRLAELCEQGGLPPGVLNVVTGMGEEAGNALCTAAGVDAIAFTGSTETGRLVMQAASGTLKKISLECGGKSPDVIFADANLDQAIQGAFVGMFYNQGEVCNAGSRLLVASSIYDTVVQGLVDRARSLRLGDPLDPQTELGCLVSREQLERVVGYINIGEQEGASLLTGGKTWGEKGFFVEPTIFADVDPGMRIFQEEIFGPVLTVTRFDSDEDAIRLANDTAYGLAAGIWTQDISRALRVSSEIQAGTVWVNTFGPFDIASPWTGHKQSGIGTEWGRNMLEFVTIPKSTWIAR